MPRKNDGSGKPDRGPGAGNGGTDGGLASVDPVDIDTDADAGTGTGTDAGTDAGTGTDGATKRGRGRPKGTGTRTRKTAAQAPVHLDLRPLYAGLHALLAVRTHRPDVWAISEGELDTLAKADEALLRHMPLEWLERSQLAVDIMGVVSAHAAVYGPRLVAMKLPPGRPNGAMAHLQPVAPPVMQQ
jgi:hypothetical protein